jgi:asparagine synthase (glutamine-hydrolysing)
MCGIVAHLGFSPGTSLNKEQIHTLNAWHLHRGPDEGGVFVDGPMAMGIRRLSIVDVANGHQPMTTSDGRYTIVFNGEIYNHKELRQRLLSKGHSFKTTSDTEALLYAFADEGPRCLKSLNGMFAFTIWDRQAKRLFVARDRFGIKPLYYALTEDRVLFSSELRAIAHSGFFDFFWDIKAISDYLAYWYVCQPRTVFNEVKQLPPGHFAWVEAGQMRMEPWWQLPQEPGPSISFKEACGKLEGLLEESIKLRMEADVPVGLFLSGGIDSGVVGALAARQGYQNIEAFGIGFEDQSYNELPLAKLTALKSGLKFHSTTIGPLTSAAIEEVISKLDEPLGNASYVPMYFLSKLAGSHVKSVLSGDGGDELFGGYPTYQAPYYQHLWQRTPALFRNMVKGFSRRMPVSHKRISFDYRMKQLMKGIDGDYRHGHYVWRQVASLERQRSLMRPEVFSALDGHDPFEVAQDYFDQAKKLSIQNQLMYVDLKTYLVDDHLRKVDRMSMACGLEVRLPYLDYRVVEMAMRLPAAYKVNFRRTKIILKQIARPLLPKQVLQGSKKGLTSPIAGWLKGPLAEFTRERLSGGIVEELFDPTEISALWREHQGLQADHSRLLWALLTLSVWAQSLPRKAALR